MKKYLIIIALFINSLSSSELSEMQKACDAHVADACYTLGMIFGGSDKIKPNIKMSREYLTRACELDHTLACKKLEGFQSVYLKESTE